MVVNHLPLTESAPNVGALLPPPLVQSWQMLP